MLGRVRRGDAGRELAPAFARWRTGCCGVVGPVPQPLWIRCAPNCNSKTLRAPAAARQVGFDATTRSPGQCSDRRDVWAVRRLTRTAGRRPTPAAIPGSDYPVPRTPTNRVWRARFPVAFGRQASHRQNRSSSSSPGTSPVHPAPASACWLVPRKGEPQRHRDTEIGTRRGENKAGEERNRDRLTLADVPGPRSWRSSLPVSVSRCLCG